MLQLTVVWDGVPGGAAFAAGKLWKSEANKLNTTIEMTFLIFIYLPFAFTFIQSIQLR